VAALDMMWHELLFTHVQSMQAQESCAEYIKLLSVCRESHFIHIFTERQLRQWRLLANSERMLISPSLSVCLSVTVCYCRS